MKKRIVSIGLLCMLAVGLMTGCESKYDKDFKSGMEKYKNGEPMTKSEHDAVENFKEWQHDNSEHTYDDWNR